MKKVLIFGTFDIIHPGHLFLIAEAKKHGEVQAVVALDETVKKVKGRDPLHGVELRMKNLESYGVTVHKGDPSDRLRVIREVMPDIIMLGYDQTRFVDILDEYIRDQRPDLIVHRVPSYHPQYFSSSKIRSVLEASKAGFLLIDKPSGEQSMASVLGLRHITGIKQIGFAGTLDPLASGLLICGIGKATTLLDWFHVLPKTYEAELLLGSVSDTYDAEGTIQKISDGVPSESDVERVVMQFQGVLMQEPPMYSAKKVEGKRLYELARKGKVIKRAPNQVIIYSLNVLAYTYPYLRFQVTCSSGTYVRSLVHDIGRELGTGALMNALRRTAIGHFYVEQAHRLDHLTKENWQQVCVSVEDLRTEVNTFVSR